MAQAADLDRAIADLLQVEDAEALLQVSGYCEAVDRAVSDVASGAPESN